MASARLCHKAEVKKRKTQDQLKAQGKSALSFSVSATKSFFEISPIL